MNADNQRIFMCADHQFVIVSTPGQEVTTRGTPGHRVDGCARCDEAVDAAFDYMERRGSF